MITGDKGILEQYTFRNIRQEEAEQAAEIEQVCFPPNEACSAQHMRERIAKAPEMFLVAVDKNRQAGRFSKRAFHKGSFVSGCIFYGCRTARSDRKKYYAAGA